MNQETRHIEKMTSEQDISVVESKGSKQGVANFFQSYTPTTLEEWMKMCGMIANSTLCPKDFYGKPESVFIACQMGADVGLKPMQAIQNIAVINGRPCLWGDAALAVVKSHYDFIDIEEDISADKAVCTIKRKGSKDVVREFTQADAIKAGLWDKTGPWKQYPTRMLQMRARGFAMRDAFPDALRGINIAEEVRDYPAEEKNITPRVSTPRYTKDKSMDAHLYLEDIENADTVEALKEIGERALKRFQGAQNEKEEIRTAYKAKMHELKNPNNLYSEIVDANLLEGSNESVPTE